MHQARLELWALPARARHRGLVMMVMQLIGGMENSVKEKANAFLMVVWLIRAIA